MKRWTLPIALLVLGTLLAVVAGWGANAVVGSLVGLGEGETLQPVGAPAGRPVADADAGDDEAGDGAGPGRPARDVPPPRAVDRISRSQYVSAILDRNIFDHENVGRSGSSDEAEPCVGEDCDGERSDLPVVLLATLVAQPSELSAALILEENSREAWGYGIGDKILDATITGITTNRVIVSRGDGSQEFIEVGEVEDAPRPAATGNRTTGGDDDQILKEGDNKYVVSRELVDSAMADLDGLSRMARARPHKDESGNIDGFRMSGVRRNRLAYKLGIRSGDVVHSVNGKPLTSIQEAMGALNELQSSSNFSFEITRRGERQTMQYEVR